MRILKNVVVKSTCWSLATVLLFTCGGRVARADEISDFLTVSDSMGFFKSVLLNESNEPNGKATIVFPGRILDFTDNNGNQLSDILSISPITVTLSSDSNSSGGQEVEPGTNPVQRVITITGDSGVNVASDRLTVSGLTRRPLVRNIPDAAEPAETTITINPRTINFGAGGDTLTISGFTVNLVSLGADRGVDLGEMMTDTITITAGSDAPPPIPEPSSLVLFAFGLASVGAHGWLRSRAKR